MVLMANVSSSRFHVSGVFAVPCGFVDGGGNQLVDDIHSLPDSLRMAVQIVSILLMFWSINLGSEGMVHGSGRW